MNYLKNNIVQILFVLLLAGCGSETPHIVVTNETQPCCQPLQEDQIKSQAK